jgi:chemotaxis protein methyltransferase CheR
VPQSMAAKISSVSILRKFVAGPFLRANEWVWNCLPSNLKATPPIRYYGTLMHSLVGLRADRTQYHGTFFLRNRPELELIRAFANRKAQGATMKIAVVACSNGAEVYSFAWAIRSVRPDLKLVIHAVDISHEIVGIAQRGVYVRERDALVDAPICERLTEEETAAFFDREGNQFRIKDWLKEGIHWHVGDAGDPKLAQCLGPQDILVANRFLCHMFPPEAEKCLRKLVGLVRPGGYLFVSGVDLEIRTKVAGDLGWIPVPEMMEEMHNGDPSVRNDWPWRYWGLEPFNSKRHDFRLRYASVFQIGQRC